MIAIRSKPLKTGKHSLYLDIYEKGLRQQMFLGLHISQKYKSNKKILKQDLPQVESAMQMAEAIAKGEINSPKSVYNFPLLKDNKRLRYILNHFRNYSGNGNLYFSELTPEWFTGFEKYLKTKMTENSVNIMKAQLKWILNKAVNNGLMSENPLNDFKTKRILKENVQVLSESEIEKLVNTEVFFDVKIKQAFLFSLYSGLRWNEIKKLTWEQIFSEKNEKGKQKNYIRLQHSQSNDFYTLELTKQANEIISSLSTGHKTGLIFYRLPEISNAGFKLRLWSAMAGLEKQLSFGMGRNTFVMNLVNSGASIKEVSAKLCLRKKNYPFNIGINNTKK